MIIFSKNNYKYFIGFLITFIFIVLVYGNYNLKINIIETLNHDQSSDVTENAQTTTNTLNCDQSSDVTENAQTTTELGSGGQAVSVVTAADYQSKQGCSDVNS